MVANQSKKIGFYAVAEIFVSVYNRSATIEKAFNRFGACGLWPLNDKIFSDDVFVASALTDEPELNEMLLLQAKYASS